MNVDQNQAPAKYLKSKQDGGSSYGKKNNLKIIAMILGLLIFIGGGISVFLISQKQDTAPIAPNVPQSKPAAYIEKTQTCTLEFDVTEPDKIACGATGCVADADCATGNVCVGPEDGAKYCAKEAYETACLAATDANRVTACCTPPETEKLACGDKDCKTTSDCSEGFVCISTSKEDANGDAIKYCAKEDYLDACVANPSLDSCCKAPEVTTLSCGESGCATTSDCKSGFVCISTSKTDAAGKIVKYCADEDYLDACVASPSTNSCCSPAATITTTVTATATATLTTTVNPTNTVTPSVTNVITTVGCNDSCKANADCSNISHICYQGSCRLDVNPTDAQCKLPSGETTIVRPIKVPTQSGPADWMNYVKAGLGTLGVGALLLLLL